MAIINFNSISGVSTISVASSITVGNNVSIGTDRVTATSFSGNLTGNVTGNVSASGVSTLSSAIVTGNVGIQTNDITRSDLVGAGNSFVGLYIGDGFLAFSTSLSRPGGYYIATSVNALNAGPVTLGSTMTLHGTWVII